MSGTLSAVEKAPATVRRWWPLGLLAAYLLLALLAVVPLMDAFGPGEGGALFVYTCFGVIPVVFAVLSGGLAWSHGPLWLRHVIHWQLAALAAFAWLAGFVLADEWQDMLEAIEEVFFVVPLVGLAVQTPLWAVRQLWGWRLIRETDEFPVSPDSKLSIGQLMVTTFVVAVALAMVRAAGNDGWEVAAIAAGSGLAASTLVLLPVACCLLALESWRRGVAYLLVVASLLVVGMWLWAWMAWPIVSRRPWELFCYSYTLLVHAGTLIFAGWAVRAAGYRLGRA